MNLWAEIQRLESLIGTLFGRVTGYLFPPQGPANVVYYIDPSNVTGKANDNNPGSTASLPFLTTAPFLVLLYFRNLLVNVDVYVMSDFPNGAPTWFLDFTVGNGSIRLWIHGTPTVVHTGTLSASVDVNTATNTLMTVTDQGGFDFSTFVGASILEITSGPNTGLRAPVRGSAGGGIATLAALGSADPTSADISPISHLATPVSYRLLAPTKIPSVQWNVNGPYNGLSAANLGCFVVTDVAVRENPNSLSIVSGTGQIQFGSCLLGSMSWDAPQSASHTCCIKTAGSTHFIFGDLIVNGGLAYNAVVEVEAGAHFTCDDWGMENNAVIACDAAAHINLLTVNAFRCDTPFVVQGYLRLFLAGHVWWGSGNTTTTLAIAATGVAALATAGNTITITSVSGVDFTMDGQTSMSNYWKLDGTIAAGPTTNTWTHFLATNGAGGFGGFVTAANTGARLVTSATV